MLNDVSVASRFNYPVHTTLYIGSVSKIKKTVLHPGVKNELQNAERDIDDEEYESLSRRIKLDPTKYIDAIEYEAALVYAPENLLEPNVKFIRVTCDCYLCGEEEVLEQLYTMTTKLKFFVSVIALVEGNNYERRVISKPGYGQFHISDIRIVDQDKELERFSEILA
ncbi:hypothetical protein NIES2101_12750 [Calothrix sp. HK-06]|nr:hypothetical protein NIES2101_12750 [Calothrix sp. HK-06]